MGFLSSIKSLFNKNIECGNEIDDNIVFFMKNKKYLYLNKNAYVRDKNACVVVYKYKVCDVLLSGKYRINQDSISETYGKAKIEKNLAKGRKIKKIRADIYFVNLNEFKRYSYISDIPFKTKTSSIGKLKGCMAGTCNVRVLDAGALLKALISGNGRIHTKDVEREIGKIIGNKINHLIEKQKIPFDMLLNNQSYVEELINADMQDALDRVGLFVSNVSLKAINFPKKYQQKVNELMSKQQCNVKSLSIETLSSPQENAGFKVPLDTRPAVAVSKNTMQSSQKTVNVGNFKVCKFCRKQCDISAKICINCGNKF